MPSTSAIITILNAKRPFSECLKKLLIKIAQKFGVRQYLQSEWNKYGFIKLIKLRGFISKPKNTNKIAGCIGCGVCVDNEPEIFCFSQSGLAEIKNIEKFNDYDIISADWQCPAQVTKK